MTRCQRGSSPDDVSECPHCEDPEMFGPCERTTASYEEPELDEDEDDEWEGWVEDGDADLDFADPGGRSALRAATEDNPRIYPCPSCGRPDRLTAKDVALGYQCDRCADAAEGFGP